MLKLLTRRLRSADFANCWRLVVNRPLFSEHERDTIERAWSVLLANDVMRGVVIFDADSANQDIVAFGASTLVDRNWAEQAKLNPRPLYAIRALLTCGTQSCPILQ